MAHPGPPCGAATGTPYLIKHINAKEKVQKHFTKDIHSLTHLSYPERPAALDIEPLELGESGASVTFEARVSSMATVLVPTSVRSEHLSSLHLLVLTLKMV